jgi:phage regulator Rha-like protein
MLDRDLAELYGVTTKQLNQQVKRNIKRFPEDFMFQLNEEEKTEVVTICDHLASLKFSPNLPYAFAEHGAVMLASILNSNRAIEVNIQIVRVFTKMREMLLTHKDILLHTTFVVPTKTFAREFSLRTLRLSPSLEESPQRTQSDRKGRREFY